MGEKGLRNFYIFFLCTHLGISNKEIYVYL